MNIAPAFWNERYNSDGLEWETFLGLLTEISIHQSEYAR